MSGALERKRRRNEPREREGVRSPERFSDAYAPPDPEWPEKRGPEATAIAGLLARSCCGWRRRPTSAEFYDAIRAEQPSARQEAIVDVLMLEASEHTMTLAYLAREPGSWAPSPGGSWRGQSQNARTAASGWPRT